MSSPKAKPLAPKHNVYANLDEVREDLHALFAGMQQLNHRVVDAAPTTNQIKEGQILLMDDGTNRRIYTKINGTIRLVALT